MLGIKVEEHQITGEAAKQIIEHLEAIEKAKTEGKPFKRRDPLCECSESIEIKTE